MQSIMTDDETLSIANHLAWAKMGQKNHAPRGVDRGPVSVRQAPLPGLWPRFRAPSCRNGSSVDHSAPPFMSS